MKISVVIYDGFDELDAIAPFEVFQNARSKGAALVPRLVGAHSASNVTGSHRLRVVPEGVLDEDCDWVLVPGGNWATRSEVGAWGEIVRETLPKKLAHLRNQGKSMASVCTGAMILSAAGITKNRPVATHHAAHGALVKEGAQLVKERVVDDGDLLTAGGVTSGLDLALWFVERFCGAELSLRVSESMEYERRGKVYQSSNRGTPHAVHSH